MSRTHVLRKVTAQQPTDCAFASRTLHGLLTRLLLDVALIFTVMNTFETPAAPWQQEGPMPLAALALLRLLLGLGCILTLLEDGGQRGDEVVDCHVGEHNSHLR